MQRQSLFARWQSVAAVARMVRKNTDDRKPLRGSKALSSRRQDCAPLGNDSQLRIPGLVVISCDFSLS
jgi:hypothetical protein